MTGSARAGGASEGYVMSSVNVSPAPATGNFTIEPLFSLPPRCTVDAMTPGGHGIGFFATDDGRVRACWDDHLGDPFDQVAQLRDGSTAITVSDDGEHVAYVGIRDGGCFVGRDDREEAPFYDMTGSVVPVFSHCGAHLAYGAGLEPSPDSVPSGWAEFRLIVDGEAANTKPVAPVQVVFSPTGDHIAFVEIRAIDGNQVEERIVVDGVPGPWFDGMRNAMGAMQFSPDGRRFAYYRTDGSLRARWIVDGQAQRWTDDVRSFSLARLRRVGIVEPQLPACFSPDSRRFAYAADVDGRGVAVVEDDVEGPRFKEVGMPVFSPDSQHLAYTARTFSNTVCLVLDGEAGPEWQASELSSPVFSRDSRHAAILYRKMEGHFLRKRKLVGCFVDQESVAEVEGDDFYADPVFSPDSEHVAWWLGHYPRIEMMLDDGLHAPEYAPRSAAAFAPTGDLVYAVAIPPAGRETILMGGRLGPVADFVTTDQSTKAVYVDLRTGHPILPFAVAPDEEHVAWAGVFGEEARPAIDDRTGPAFDRVFGARFGASGTATWFAQRDETVYRVRLT